MTVNLQPKHLEMRDIAARRPRVLVFDHTAALGGGEIALLNLVRTLAQPTCPFDIEVMLGAEGPLLEKLEAIGMRPHVMAMDAAVAETRKESLGAGGLMQLRRLGSVLGYARRLARWMRQHDIDLLHTNSLKADVIGGLAGRLARVPVLWHVRDRIVPEYLPRAAAAGFRNLARVLPAALVANSEATLQTLPARKRRFVVHDGVRDIPPTPPTPLRGSAPVLGLVGRISPWKGQHVFLQAAAEVLNHVPAARFQIVGAPLFNEQAYEQNLHDLVARLEIGHAVEFTGFRPDVTELMGRMDIVVHASTIGEPFGQVVIEAMAAARPVIATRGGGVPEIVQEGETGLLTPMNDPPALAEAMLTLLRDAPRAVAMGQAGRQRVVEHFMIAHTAERIMGVYSDMLGIAATPEVSEETPGSLRGPDLPRDR